MKIIEKGNKTVKCKRCGCVMEYDLNDIKRKNVIVKISEFLNLSELWRVEYINCPQCGKEIVINNKCV